MLQEFEQALARGEGLDGLEKARNLLTRMTDEERQDRLRQIENDFKVCQLIRFGLDQDKKSMGYGVAKGIVNWYQRKYPDNDGQLARDLIRDVRRSEYEERMKKENGAKDYDSGNERKQAEDTNEPGDNGNAGTESRPTAEGVPTEVPKEQSRPCAEVE